MNRIIPTLLLIFLLIACGDNSTDRSDTAQTSENDIDAARNFINLALDGKWTEARQLMVQDSLNNVYLDLAERNYQQRLDLDARIQYRNATINIRSVDAQPDGSTVVHYSNSYRRQEDSVKVVQQNGQWLVDLKYSFPESKTAP